MAQEDDDTKAKVPKIQTLAPLFSGMAVVNGQFKEISLSKYKGKYVVLLFYPLDFTFVCPTELVAFSDKASEFRDINCEIIAASCDSEFCHLAWVNMARKEGGLGNVDIPLYADKSLKVARQYGILNEETGVPYRAFFIIDDKQYIRQITINDLTVGRSVDEVLRLVQAFQFTDKYGEVCPAGWIPGRSSMKPDPKGAKEYFEKAFEEQEEATPE